MEGFHVPSSVTGLPRAFPFRQAPVFQLYTGLYFVYRLRFRFWAMTLLIISRFFAHHFVSSTFVGGVLFLKRAKCSSVNRAAPNVTCVKKSCLRVRTSPSGVILCRPLRNEVASHVRLLQMSSFRWTIFLEILQKSSSADRICILPYRHRVETDLGRLKRVLTSLAWYRPTSPRILAFIAKISMIGRMYVL